MTIAMGGMDIDIGILVNMRFIERKSMAMLAYVERGVVLAHKHSQGVAKGSFSLGSSMAKNV